MHSKGKPQLVRSIVHVQNGLSRLEAVLVQTLAVLSAQHKEAESKLALRLVA